MLGSYERGEKGIKKSLKRAVQLYELSAAQGFVTAQFQLGQCFYRGMGVKLDIKKALKYYTLAADQGDAEAQYNCGAHYFNGEGVEPDGMEAMRYFELSAAQGHQGAQKTLITIQNAFERRSTTLTAEEVRGPANFRRRDRV